MRYVGTGFVVLCLGYYAFSELEKDVIWKSFLISHNCEIVEPIIEDKKGWRCADGEVYYK
jgi:hypothetical protein